MIKILQHYTPSFKPLIDFSRPIHEEYCKIHGYELVIKECEYEKYDGLQKLKMFHESLNMGDIGLIIDADALITNLTVKIESFIEEDYDFFFTGDVEKFNTGIFIVRKSPFSLYQMAYLKHLVEIGKANCEQDGFIESIRLYPYKKKYFKFIPHPAFNSYPCELYPEHGNEKEEQGCWREGHFILHVPGQSIEKRLEYFKKAKITR